MKERLDAVAKRLAMDEDGVLTLDGLRTVILPAIVLTSLEDASEWLLGSDLGPALYAAGRDVGRDIGGRWKPREGSSIPETFAALLREIEARGFGRIEVVADAAPGTAIVRLHASPYCDRSEGAREGACQFPAGFLAGAFAALVHHEIEAAETRCRGMGEAYCEFHLVPVSGEAGVRASAPAQSSAASPAL